MLKPFSGSGARHALVAVATTICAGVAFGAVIRVPRDVSTIQGAIDAAHTGDIVLVSPGTYLEHIDFDGKAIIVTSTAGAATTIIDAGRQRSVVTFQSNERRTSVLSGFTLRNGNAANYTDDGGGVEAYQASPTIVHNVITGNSACRGNGVALEFSSALLKDNRIYGNHQDGCSGATVGGGVFIGGAGRAEVVGNAIEDNETDYEGGGIGMDSAGEPHVARNVIRRNTARYGGGGAAVIDESEPVFSDNVVYGNSAPRGGGIFISVPIDSFGPTVLNNTFADDVATDQGSELYVSGFDAHVGITNNIFRASEGASAIFCDGVNRAPFPVFTSNDLYTTTGTLLEGPCRKGILGRNGNLSLDPQFVAGDGKTAAGYALQATSPAIDAGSDGVPAGKLDRAGNARVVDGDGDGKAVIDLGAYEYSPG